jgi:hypothetical protein
LRGSGRQILFACAFTFLPLRSRHSLPNSSHDCGSTLASSFFFLFTTPYRPLPAYRPPVHLSTTDDSIRRYPTGRIFAGLDSADHTIPLLRRAHRTAYRVLLFSRGIALTALIAFRSDIAVFLHISLCGTSTPARVGTRIALSSAEIPIPRFSNPNRHADHLPPTT